MCLSIFTHKIWIDYLENITKEQEKVDAQCQSASLKATIYYATFFAEAIYSNWKLHALNV